MKRFYKNVAVAGDAGNFRVELDGRAIKTPMKADLRLQNRTIAQLVADEWRAQTDKIDAASMLHTKLATSVIDLLPNRKPGLIDEVAGYASSDLLCFRSTSPESLVARQAKAYEPWRLWARDELDIDLPAKTGFEPNAIDPALQKHIERTIHAHDDWQLVGLHHAVRCSGSLILGLAMAAGNIDAQTIHQTACFEELFGRKVWGAEQELDRRLDNLKRDFEALEAWFQALQNDLDPSSNTA